MTAASSAERQANDEDEDDDEVDERARDDNDADDDDDDEADVDLKYFCWMIFPNSSKAHTLTLAVRRSAAAL